MTDTTKAIPTRKNVSRPYTPLTAPISAADAEQGPADARTFQEAQELQIAPYARRQYTIDAVSPLGFPVHLTFADIKLTELAGHIAALAKLGYTPPMQAGAAPVATPDDLPEGWKLCQKHGAPMRPRNKQNQNWHSHNVGTKEHPVWCKGYRGSDSPGYEVE